MTWLIHCNRVKTYGGHTRVFCIPLGCSMSRLKVLTGLYVSHRTCPPLLGFRCCLRGRDGIGATSLGYPGGIQLAD